MFSDKSVAFQRALKSSIPNVVGFLAGSFNQNLKTAWMPRIGADGVVEFTFAQLRADVAVPMFDGEHPSVKCWFQPCLGLRS